MTARGYAHLETLVLSACAIGLVALTWTVDVSALMSLSVFVILGILALSVSFAWGVAGIFSFGQSVFFGIGAYTYAVVTVNAGDSTFGIATAIVASGFTAVILGYFMLYGRISDIYLAVITLTLSLLIFQFVNTLSGDSAQFGEANVGGFNGMPGVPPINVPGLPDKALGIAGMYLLSVFALIAAYGGLRFVLTTAFGQTVVAIRENELRAELLGYDSRVYKLAVFTAAAVLASISGVLFAAWGSFIEPGVFSIGFAGQIIIWAMVGGISTLIGPVVGCFIIQGLTTWLGTAGLVDTNLVLGAIFILFVLLVPSGLIPTLRRLVVTE